MVAPLQFLVAWPSGLFDWEPSLASHSSLAIRAYPAHVESFRAENQMLRLFLRALSPWTLATLEVMVCVTQSGLHAAMTASTEHLETLELMAVHAQDVNLCCCPIEATSV